MIDNLCGVHDIVEHTTTPGTASRCAECWHLFGNARALLQDYNDLIDRINADRLSHPFDELLPRPVSQQRELPYIERACDVPFCPWCLHDF